MRHSGGCEIHSLVIPQTEGTCEFRPTNKFNFLANLLVGRKVGGRVVFEASMGYVYGITH